MNKNETRQQVQPVTYTCPMHPEIQTKSPGNCPECGMKLIKEKPKQVANPESVEPSDVQKPEEKETNTGMDMDTMQMDNMNNMPMSKATPDNLKTIENNTPPRTVRYDLYIADTIVTFG